MKKNNLVLKTSFFPIALIISVYFFMQFVTFFRDNIIIGTSSLVGLLTTSISFVSIFVIPPMLLCLILFYIYILPMQRTLAKFHNNEDVDIEEQEKTRKRMASFPAFLFGVNFFGFVLGAFILILIEDGPRGFLSHYRQTTLMSNICASIIYASSQVSVSNILFQELRDYLHITEKGNRKKQIKQSTKQIITGFFLMLYALCFYEFNSCVFEHYRTVNRKTERLLQAPNANKEAIINEYRETISVIVPSLKGRPSFDVHSIPLPWEQDPNIEEHKRWSLFLLMTLYLVPLSLIVLFTTSLEVLQQVQATRDRLKDVVEGKGNLTERLAIRNFDEYGELTEYINKVLNRFHEITKSIVHSANETQRSASLINSLLRRSQEATNSAEETSLYLSDALTAEADASKEITQSLLEVQNAAQIVQDAIEEQKAFTSATASAMEEMTANIHSVMKMTHKSRALAQDLNTQGAEGEQATLNTERAMQEIENASEDVLQVLHILSKISNDTNLLSMNAAIEAAHAGKAGAGFAVVADEVRKLAQNATSQTNIIKDLLANMKTRVENGVAAAQQSGQTLSTLSTGITQTASITSEITQAMDEQTKGTNNVEQSMKVLVQSTATIAERMIDQNKKTKRMETILKQTLEQLSHLAESSLEQADAMKQMKKTISRIQEESERNITESEKLREIIAGLTI